jgi:hypothetical protein
MIIENVATVPAPGTTLGAVSMMRADRPPSITPGNDIVARVGVGFGYELVIKGAPYKALVPLYTRVTHPPITNPANGKTETVDGWDSPLNAGIPRYAAWNFDHPWELVAGTWRIEVMDHDRVIASQVYNVTTGDAGSGTPARH